MKRDLEGYESIHSQFDSFLELFRQQAAMNFTSITGIASDSTVAKDLGVRAKFLAHVAPLYPNHLADFPKKSPICSIELQDCSLRGFASTSPMLSLYSLINRLWILVKHCRCSWNYKP